MLHLIIHMLHLVNTGQDFTKPFATIKIMFQFPHNIK